MAVDAVAAATTTTSTRSTTTTSDSTTDSTDATLNYDSFLKLLVAQMQNQDPTDPVDASEQMSQLASFSNVEQAIKTNKHLESLIQETSLSQATGLIGKTLTSADGETSGVVTAVDVNADGLTATLENGKTIEVTSGVTVGTKTSSGAGGLRACRRRGYGRRHRRGTHPGSDPGPGNYADLRPQDPRSDGSGRDLCTVHRIADIHIHHHDLFAGGNRVLRPAATMA
jgi:flagellar basal-body rod modification protein FlgD